MATSLPKPKSLVGTKVFSIEIEEAHILATTNFPEFGISKTWIQANSNKLPVGKMSVLGFTSTGETKDSCNLLSVKLDHASSIWTFLSERSIDSEPKEIAPKVELESAEPTPKPSNVLEQSSGNQSSPDKETKSQLVGLIKQFKAGGPQWDKNFYISSLNLRIITAVATLASAGKNANILMVGASGNGKTSIAEQTAKAFGMGYVRINCPLVRDPEEFFGVRGLSEGNTTFVDTAFTKGIEAGNTVVCLDEINRLEPWLLNALFPILDDSRETTVHGRTIKVAPGTIIIMTMNKGFGYTGTFELDTALSNRANVTLKVDVPPAEIEQSIVMARTGVSVDQVRKIIMALSTLRYSNLEDVDLSVRISINIGNLVSVGIGVLDAFQATIGNFSPSVNKAIVDAVNSAK